mmetsp:Transcript_9510/g.23938  ORF Transcript_9510/g.23938 Transcript_9510/m.23938 type:complete len:264 (-) Transcript_9510:186-977(-)
MPPLREIHHEGHQVEDQGHAPVEAQHGEGTDRRPRSAEPCNGPGRVVRSAVLRSRSYQGRPRLPASNGRLAAEAGDSGGTPRLGAELGSLRRRVAATELLRPPVRHTHPPATRLPLRRVVGTAPLGPQHRHTHPGAPGALLRRLTGAEPPRPQHRNTMPAATGAPLRRAEPPMLPNRHTMPAATGAPGRLPDQRGVRGARASRQPGTRSSPWRAESNRNDPVARRLERWAPPSFLARCQLLAEDDDIEEQIEEHDVVAFGNSY